MYMYVPALEVQMHMYVPALEVQMYMCVSYNTSFDAPYICTYIHIHELLRSWKRSSVSANVHVCSICVRTNVHVWFIQHKFWFPYICTYIHTYIHTMQVLVFHTYIHTMQVLVYFTCMQLICIVPYIHTHTYIHTTQILVHYTCMQPIQYLISFLALTSMILCVCMYVCVHGYMHLCDSWLEWFVCMYVCVHEYMHVCDIFISINLNDLYVCMYVCMDICMYVISSLALTWMILCAAQAREQGMAAFQVRLLLW